MLHKALMSVLTCAFPTWEFIADTCLMNFQHLQNKVLCTIGNFLRCTLNHKLHVAFNFSYKYDFITELCRQHADIM